MAQSGHSEATYGFIGLGVMGWGMAKNLRAKIPVSSKLIVCELSESRRDQFVRETEGIIEVVLSPKAVAEEAVSLSRVILSFIYHNLHLKQSGHNHYYASKRPACL